MGANEIDRLTPPQAAELLEDDPRAVLLDVRSRVEFEYVGHPIGAIHVAWKEFPEWQENAAFADEVGAQLSASGDRGKDRALLLICRSGVRSMQAAERLRENGYTQLYNVEEGFEGDKDDEQHRGNVGGWRFHGLPWEQG